MYIDENEIKKALKILKPNNELFEIRILSGKRVTSGYFTDPDSMIQELKKLNTLNSNIYFVLNQIDLACYAREQSNKFVTDAKTTTQDSDIVNREWFFIDLDPVRPTGVSATDEELRKAKELAKKIEQYLTSFGFEEPIRATSGNGYHLLYKISTPNTKENTDLIKSCLEVLRDEFSENVNVDVDTSVFNPSRICKLYGSTARKGANTETRPHRMSRIIKTPDEIKTTPIEKLELLSSKLHKVNQESIRQNKKKNKTSFNLDEFLMNNGITYKECPRPGRDNSRILALDRCPFDANHVNGDSKIFAYPDGAVSFTCHHNSCINRKWQDVRKMFDPDYNPDDYDLLKHEKKDYGKPLDEDDDETPFDFSSYDSISADAIDLDNIREPYVMIKDYVEEGVKFVVAPSKGGKSRMVLQMCLDIVRGSRFLDHFETNKCECLYLALEDDYELDFKKRLKSFLGDEPQPSGLHVMCGDLFPYVDDKSKIRRIPRLGKGGGLSSYIRNQIEKHPNIRLVAIDVFGTIRSKINPKERIDFIEHERRDINELLALASDLKICILVSHHVAKGSIHNVKMSDTAIGSGAGSYAISGTVHGELSLIRDPKDRTLAILRSEGRRTPSTAVVVRDSYPRWEFVSTLSDYVQEKKDNESYEETSGIIETVKYLVERDGTWKGTAKQFQTENELNNDLPPITKAVNKNSFTQLILHRLKLSGINYKQKTNGTAPITHQFSKIPGYIPSEPSFEEVSDDADYINENIINDFYEATAR